MYVKLGFQIRVCVLTHMCAMLHYCAGSPWDANQKPINVKQMKDLEMG